MGESQEGDQDLEPWKKWHGASFWI